MDAIFSAILEMSLSASVIAIAVILLRPLLRKAPKWLTCALWALVALRLLCPLALESPVSLMPDTAPVAQQVISLQPEAAIVDTGAVIPQQNGLTVHIQSDIPEEPFQFRFWMGWAVGVAGMLVYLLVSFLTVRRRVAAFLDIAPGVRQCDNIDTPFILGLFRPVIYLPSGLPEDSREYVLAHERAHLRRCDHLWKPLGFLLLSLHWFNPVLWLSYILLCRDIELACDEKVIKTMDDSEKTSYSQALLDCSIRQRFVTACPLAFGEVGVKARVKSILSYKKPAFWIILVALVAGIGLGIFFLTDRPEEDPEITKASFEAVVQYTDIDGLLEVQVLDPDGNYKLFIRADGLELPALKKGDRIFATYDAADSLADGVVSTVIDLGILEEPPIADLEKHLEGTVIAVEGNSMQVQERLGTTTINYYVNLKGHSVKPKPGDKVMVHYYPGDDPKKLEQVKDIRITEVADWGVTLRVSDVTATTLTLWVGVASGFPRELTTTDAICLQKAEGDTWVDVIPFPDGTLSSGFHPLSDGDIFTIDWTTVYHPLEPGTYRLHKPIRYREEARVYTIDFTVPLPLSADLEEAVSQTVRYYISKRLVNPPHPHDKTMEQIPQANSTGFLDDPTTTLTEGKTYEQIAVSHSVIAQDQLGTEYRLIVAAYCRGYNNRQLADSIHCTMRLVFQQNQDGTFAATSCMIPTQLSGQADAELLFGPELAKQLREDWMLWDSLAAACDAQVESGVLTVKGFGRTFSTGSLEATLIENAISSGKKLKKAYSDDYVSTIFVGDTVYYFYFKAGIIHNATEDIYIQLTKEGSNTVSTIFQTTTEE